MPAVDVSKLRIHRQKDRLGIDLRHANQACVGKVHGDVAVLREERSHRRCFVFQVEDGAHHSPLDHLHDGFSSTRQASDEVDRFGKDGLAREERGTKPTHRIDGPTMMAVASVEKGDEGPRIDEGRFQRP
jgi:hypothetical protein